MKLAVIAIVLLVFPVSALTLKGHIDTVKTVDVFLGYKSGFISYNLTNENYTICISNGKQYCIKPDESGNFSIDLPKGIYKIWVSVRLPDKNTSVIADVPYLYFYPMKSKPIIVKLTKDTFVTIKPEKARWYPPEPIMPNTRLRIVGHVYDPENANLTAVLFITSKPFYRLKTRVRNGTFEFKNVIPAENYTILIIPKEITLRNGSKIIYKKTYVNFKPYATPKRMVIKISVEIPHETIESESVPSFGIATALLLAIFIALRRTSLR